MLKFIFYNVFKNVKMGITRKVCMAFGALLSVTIVALMFGIILFIFITNSQFNLSNTINTITTKTFSPSSSNLMTIDNQSKVITVESKNIEKFYEQLQNEKLENEKINEKKISNKKKKIMADEKKHKDIVRIINSRQNSTWIAKLNPSAIGYAF